MKKGLVWFRFDLRLHDNLVLTKASKECDELVCVYVLDDTMTTANRWGISKMGEHRLAFLQECLYDLRNQLQKQGGDLVIKKGNTAKEFAAIQQEFAFETIYTSSYPTKEEQDIRQAVEDKFNVQAFQHHQLFQAPIQNKPLPKSFTSFRKRVEKSLKTVQPLPVPNQLKLTTTAIPSNWKIEPKRQLPELTAIPFYGGETNGLNHMQNYIWQSHQIQTYKATRNQAIGKNYSTKFSIYLANGCLSAKQIIAEVNKYESEVKSNQSTYWVKFELLWREFFIQMAYQFKDEIFYPFGIEGQQSANNYSGTEEDFTRWKTAQTGVDFVDAHMKELNATGFMSNRGRQNVASYCIYNLKTDWRKGASWYEHQLIDFEPAVNTGNWLYIAGHGFNSRGGRQFNINKQAYTYDRNEKYRNLWLDKNPGGQLELDF